MAIQFDPWGAASCLAVDNDHPMTKLPVLKWARDELLRGNGYLRKALAKGRCHLP